MIEKLPIEIGNEDIDVIEIPEQGSVDPASLFETLSISVTDFSFLQKGTHCGK